MGPRSAEATPPLPPPMKARLHGAREPVRHRFNPKGLGGRARWPDLLWLFDAAEALATTIGWAAITAEQAKLMVSFTPAVRRAAAGQRAAIRLDLAWVLNSAIRQNEIDRAYAHEAIQRALAPLLDRRAPDKELRRAVIEAGQALFHPRELRAIIEAEQAWWVRLHVQLAGSEVARAA